MDAERNVSHESEKINLLNNQIVSLETDNYFLRKLLVNLNDLRLFICKKDDSGNHIISFCRGCFDGETGSIEAGKLQDLLDPVLYNSIKPYYDQAFEGEDIKFSGYLQDNRYYSTKLIPFSKNKDGAVIELMGVTQDITDTFIDKIKTQRETEILDNIIENNPYSIQILDSEGHHVRSNNAFLNMFKALPDQKWTILKDPLILQHGLITNIEKVFNGEIVKMPPFWYNAHLVDPKYPNQSICLGSVLFPVFINHKKLEYVVVMHEDITSRVLAREELLKAKEKAEEADRQKTAFLANMSHEIRTPMNGIIGFAELLKNPNLSHDKQDKYIKIIEQSGVRLINIINDLIDITKLESGLMEMNPSEVDLNEEMDFIFYFFEPEASRKGLVLRKHCEIQQGRSKFITDKEKLLAIFTNLVKNAIKFTVGGEIDFGYQKDNEGIVFFVKDTGVGITGDQQKNIFNRFVQLDNGSKDVNDGSGLGLSITKALVELLGGQIWLHSEKNIGTTFYFTIEHQQLFNPERPPMAVQLDNVEGDNITKGKTILAVDDDEVSLMFLSIVLDGQFAKVLLAKNGDEAVDLYKKNGDIDLVLMDIKMPKLDGVNAALEMKTLNGNIPIIAQTAYALEIDMEAYRGTFDEYVTKPIKIDELKRKISQVMDR